MSVSKRYKQILNKIEFTKSDMEEWKMGRRKHFYLLVLVLGVLIIVTACGSNQSAGVGGNDAVTIGYFPNLDHAAAIVGKQKGYFEEALGEEPAFVHFPNGNDFIEGLSTGRIDIGYVGPGPAINYYLTGGDIVVLGAAANGATLIVAREDSEIETLDDFAGKSFGTPGNGCTHNVQLEIMLKQKGLTTNRIGGEVIHQTRIDPASIINYFEQGEMDAYAAPEPWGTYLVEELNAKVIAEWNEVFLGEELASVVLVTTRSYLEEHPEKVQKVLEAHVRSVQFAQENTEDTLTTVNDEIFELTQTRLPETVLEKAWERLEVTYETHADALQEWATASYDLKFLELAPDLDGFVDTSYLEAVLGNFQASSGYRK